ncbi:ribosome-binding protein 1-like [Falco rusticolus]|uniref:ribosome-binding protein 1-like n=1 Tax=Falco rusticolus TaxID=120794 RepID=UPI0018868DB0|nr:ribosome-binding protein 1-like [Falco rusticolus]
MQASHQQHVKKTQQLQDKIRTLQEQLENGPNTQLARLQQENSMLRDALYQTSSWLESKHNPELARLREEYAKLMNELPEQSKVLQQKEQQRKSLELKASALQKEVEQLQRPVLQTPRQGRALDEDDDEPLLGTEEYGTMDVYDPQMLDVVVFGGLMVVLAIGIFLLFSFMKKVLLPSEEALAKQAHEEQKPNGPVKKAAASNKSESAPADSDGPLYLPYKTLVSTVSSTAFSEGEAQRLIEILREEAGIVQDTWHTAMQTGYLVAVLERQLEEKEKQLATEQEAAAAARNKRRELSKELVAERAKVTALEGKLKVQLLACEQELELRQARMQAINQDHAQKTQQLQDKIRTLQEQLENGPNTQLARLQQENSMLRDALYQTSSWLESKYNPELARLREEYAKLMNELSEQSKVLQRKEQQRKSLELKASALQMQMEQLQAQKSTGTMDVYDPQMLDVVVFGGLMVVLAIGIFLFFSFLEKVLLPSVEALAKQGKYINKTKQQKKVAKKKKKAVGKKGNGKKMEEKPNGNIPEQHQSAPVDSSVTIKKTSALPAHAGQRHNGPVKKAAASNKSESAPADSDGPLYLPYKTLVSTVSSTAFSEGEAQRLIEILREEAGIVQDTWHTAMQTGYLVAVLERQLEEKEKQLATEQEAAAAARNKRRELSKELVAERAKVTALEGKLKVQLLACEQELELRQARMQAINQDHAQKTQQLQDKIRTLQEQLENGPNTQLARLQQENSMLRDALYQTSWLESKYNPELARLREYGKLLNELSEKSKVLQQEEQQRKSLELKAAALQMQMEQLQVRQAPANLLPSERWGAWLNCVGSMGLAMGRARGEMSVRIWKASCLADLFIASCPLSVCHMPGALLCIAGKAQGARCPGGSRSRSPVKLTSRL